MICYRGNLSAEVEYPHEVRLYSDGKLVELVRSFRTIHGLRSQMSSTEHGMAIARRWIRKQRAAKE